MTTVRETRRADELKTGDWVASLGRQAATGLGRSEILFVHPYTDDVGNARVYVTASEVGYAGPQSIRVDAAEKVQILTEDELRAGREEAERAQKIADIRTFADWLGENPWAPMPHSDFYAYIDGNPKSDHGPEGMAAIRGLAERLGEQLNDRGTHTAVARKFGTVEYEVRCFHKGGRPAEPAPEPRPDFVDGPCTDSDCPNASWPHLASSDLAESVPEPAEEPGTAAEHYETTGWTGGDGGSGVACACGVQFDGFDSLKEAGDQLRRHIETGDKPASEPKPLVSDETIAEAAAMEERDRAAGGPPWEVPDHPDHQLPGGWHRGQIR